MAKARTAKRPVVQPGWVDAGKGYELGIRGGAIVARKDGAVLASVPKTLRDSALGERLSAAVDFLEEHARTCLHTVETWMLRSLPVPRAVLQSVLRDDTWATVLRDAWVVAIANDGSVDREAGGFFRGVDEAKGIGVVDRDGETTWLASELVMLPHPVLLDEIDDLRELAVQIGVTQGLSRLFRETFAAPSVPPVDPLSVASYAGAEFAMLSQATNLAKRLGYRVSGGAAVARVLEGGRFVEARFDLGDGDPMYSTATGELAWVDDKQRSLAVVDVPPVAFSEGMRMASLIHAKRKVDGGDDDA
ncbi:MAG: DUF4132 domain-containing protein [Deltaproteobacteria bacterium]|nr:DUF4132 domain-containing protein [Deltaproteobacteria bacterium]